MLKHIIEASWAVLVGAQLDFVRAQVRTAIAAIKEVNPDSPTLEDLRTLAKKLSAVASEFEGARQRAVKALEEGADG